MCTDEQLDHCSKRGANGNPTKAVFGSEEASSSRHDQISVLWAAKEKQVLEANHSLVHVQRTVDLPWSVGMRGTSLAAGDTQSIWLPLTCPSTSVRLPKEQVMPTERSGTWLTFTSSCTKGDTHDSSVNTTLRVAVDNWGTIQIQ